MLASLQSHTFYLFMYDKKHSALPEGKKNVCCISHMYDTSEKKMPFFTGSKNTPSIFYLPVFFSRKAYKPGRNTILS